MIVTSPIPPPQPINRHDLFAAATLLGLIISTDRKHLDFDLLAHDAFVIASILSAIRVE